jgi:hypothetical protein
MVGLMNFPSVTELILAHPHVLGDVERGSDVASSGGGSFAEAVRCPFETGWWSGSDGDVGVD